MPNERPSHLESLANDDRSDDLSDPRPADADLGATDPTPTRTHPFVDDGGRRLLVRPCDPATDRDALQGMYAEFDRADQAQGIPPMDPDDRRDWLDALLGGRNYVVEAGGAGVVGHAVLLADPESSTAELAVFVAPANRGVGIGTELLRTLLADPPTGVDTVRLSVERGNQPAVGLYRKLGFEVVTRRRYELVMERAPGKIP